MNCFCIFKDKSDPKKPKPAPELKDRSESNNSPSVKAPESAGSLPSTPRSITEMYKENEHKLRVFSLSELRNATNDFNKLLKIGEGGFGRVYKGTIRPADDQGDSIVVAIKRLNKNGLQGHKQWLAEVQFLGVLEHPNLVKLLGYCSVDGKRGIHRLLVYEYMPNKSLEDHLFNRALPTLPWKTRLQIILGAAQGLTYLHEGLEVQVIYRDFKSSNVLLDKNFKPKLSDFGLAREGPTGDHSHVSTAVVGTYGYAAPEYVDTGHLSIRSDIWSFGVVLYEILTGRRTVERSSPTTEQKLLEWVKLYPADSKRFTVIIDPRLRNQYSQNAARKIAKLADRCLNKNAKDRPTISQVVESLKQAIEESDQGSSKKMNPESSGISLNASNQHLHQTRVSDSARRVANLAQPKERR
ncbi:probable serine/threonine-protein kinase PBL19 [Cornus florida]|uniref:probable serine/threonine-protein kinase PBL19 n=1 Tax=Cornus florida TaxID=4283 RepID=UPI00289E9835|nr:probable serine/threonine-protein kinase PBL19 [Cornus florida]XP_059657690.1 probable serine/threonine-protein kinase PBL19 [Cornus florida]